MLGALTAALARTEPRGDTGRASLAASLATTAGGGVGPLVAGACAAWLPAPTRLCYLIEAGVLIVAAAGLLGLPAELGRTGKAGGCRCRGCRARLGCPSGRPVRLLATLTSTRVAVAVFAIVALGVAVTVAALHARWLDVAREQPV